MSTKLPRLLGPLVLGALVVGCARDPVDALLVQLADANVEVRRTALRAIVDQPISDDRLIAALTKCAGDPDADIRYTAIEALGTFGPAAQPSLPTLKSALRDSEQLVRLRAAWSISRIDRRDRSYVPIINAALQEGDGRTLLEVAATGPNAAWAVPTLTALMSHSSPKVRTLAAEALGAIGPAARTAKPALDRAQHDASPTVQTAAKTSLRRIGAPAPAKRE